MKLHVTTQEYMGDHATTFVIIVSSLASVVALIVVVLLCSCCFRRKSGSDDGDSDDDVDKAYYAPIASDDRQDVRQLRRHSWKERANYRNKSPLLTRKTIKFEGPADKKIVTENVQPEPYVQSSLNRTLGLIARELLNKGSDSDGLEGEEGEHTHTPSPRSNGSAVTASANASSPVGTPVRPSTSGLGPLSDEDFGAAAAAAAAAAADIEYQGEKLGRIQFSVNYNFQEMTLTLKIHRAVELPAKDFSGTSDPYVKILLLPDRKHKLETKIKRKNLNPRWNEAFAFEGFPYSKLQNRTLYMQVLDYDRFSRDDPIGEVVLPLGDMDLTKEHTMWKNLAPCKGSSGKLGELLLSLCYQPTVGRITVVAMKARELKARDVNGYSDPYVKIWLMHDGKKVEKKKTQIHQRNLNPVFNESFVFQVPFEKIRTTALLVSVMDYDRMSRNDVIGQVLISAKSGPMEVKHWNEMLAKSRQPVAQWHILKDFS